jgi:hypothetical protein
MVPQAMRKIDLRSAVLGFSMLSLVRYGFVLVLVQARRQAFRLRL